MFGIIRHRPALPDLRGSLDDWVDRWFDSFFQDFGLLPRGEAEYALPMDVTEEKDRVVIEMELPGLDPKDVQIQLQDGTLQIRAERKQEAASEERSIRRLERRYGVFSRTVALPNYVDPEKAAAEFRNGVLRVTLPKHEAAKPRQIEIKAG